MARGDKLKLPPITQGGDASSTQRKIPPANTRLTLPGSQGAQYQLQTRHSLDEFDAQLKWLGIGFFLTILFLLGALYNLQVVRRAEFYQFADRNFIRTEELTPDRGLIFDADEQVLAENRPVYDVYVTPEIMRYHADRYEREGEDPLALLADTVHLNANKVAGLHDRIFNSTGRADVLVARNISRDVLARIVTIQEKLPGVFIHTTQKRHYPLDDVAAHLLGYMNEISPKELEQLNAYGYHAGEYVGRTGLERTYEAVLRGAPGLRRDVVDVRGRAQTYDVAAQLLGAYREIAPVPGKNLHLTLNTRLHEILDNIDKTEPSVAVVAIDPRDGSVLDVYSRPGFNPNAWSGRLSREEKREIDDNPYHPLIDKALYSWAPGSTYKIVGALAALSEGVFDAETKVNCTGALEYGGRTFRCHKRSGHGWVDLKEAIRVSCDVYFYEVGIRLGMDTLADHAYNFGFGQHSGVGIASEQPGLVPTREWHNSHTKGGFVGGFTLGAVIGQDVVQTSPLQMALAYAALANHGRLYYPRLVDRITTADSRTVFEYAPRVQHTLPYTKEELDLVVDGLISVVDTRPDKLEYMTVAGKTGTAQVASLQHLHLQDNEIIWKQRDHAWFAAFAPVENPRIAVAVLVEHGGSGSRTALPIAMHVIDQYFREIMGWNKEIEAALSSNQGKERLQELIPTPQPYDYPRDALDIDASRLVLRHRGQSMNDSMEPIQ